MDVDASIQQISALEDRIGLAELSRRTGIARTTLADLKAKEWRPKSVQLLERLIAAVNDRDDEPAVEDDAA